MLLTFVCSGLGVLIGSFLSRKIAYWIVDREVRAEKIRLEKEDEFVFDGLLRDLESRARKLSSAKQELHELLEEHHRRVSHGSNDGSN